MYLEIILSILSIGLIFLFVEVRRARKALDNQSRIIQNGLIDQKENTEFYKDAIMKLLSEISTFRKRLENNFEDKKEIEDELLAEKMELLYDKALDIVEKEGSASASLLQRKLNIGYSMASSLIDKLEKDEIISPSEEGKPREVYSKDSVLNNEDEDELYESAVEIVRVAGKASASLLQRRLRIGYARAARLLDLMEEGGIISHGNGVSPREVYDNNSEEI